jgi:hypothetical protein
VASRALRMRTNSSSPMPSRTWMLPLRSAATVVWWAKVSRPGAF